MECERQALATQTERFYFSPQKKLEFLLGLPLDISWELVLPDGSNGGNPAGILITLKDGKRIYFAGDTALTYDMKLIGDIGGVDVAVLPIGDNFTMGPEDAIRAAEFVKAKHVVPCHYNTFPPIQQDPEAFAENLKQQTGIDCTVMDVGDTLEC